MILDFFNDFVLNAIPRCENRNKYFFPKMIYSNSGKCNAVRVSIQNVLAMMNGLITESVRESIL